MRTFEPLLDFLITSILFSGYILFLAIWGLWAVVSLPINKCYATYRKFFISRTDQVSNGNTPRL
jgi:hypothetical protein